MVRLGFGGGRTDGCPLLSGHTDGYCNTLSALRGILRLVPQIFKVFCFPTRSHLNRFEHHTAAA